LINHLLIICFVIITYEFVKYVSLNNILKSNLVVYKKILRLFKYNKASDFRKEKLILSYSKFLFIMSIKVLTIISSIFIFLMIINLISNSFTNLVISILGIIELSVVFIIYHLIRKKLYAKL
jgi:hypothetical protein